MFKKGNLWLWACCERKRYNRITKDPDIHNENMHRLELPFIQLESKLKKNLNFHKKVTI